MKCTKYFRKINVKSSIYILNYLLGYIQSCSYFYHYFPGQVWVILLICCYSPTLVVRL